VGSFHKNTLLSLGSCSISAQLKGFGCDRTATSQAVLRTDRPKHTKKHKVTAVFRVVCCSNVVIQSHSKGLIASWLTYLNIPESMSKPETPTGKIWQHFASKSRDGLWEKLRRRADLHSGSPCDHDFSFPSAEPKQLKQLHTIKIGSIWQPGSKESAGWI